MSRSSCSLHPLPSSSSHFLPTFSSVHQFYSFSHLHLLFSISGLHQILSRSRLQFIFFLSFFTWYLCESNLHTLLLILLLPLPQFILILHILPTLLHVALFFVLLFICPVTKLSRKMLKAFSVRKRPLTRPVEDRSSSQRCLVSLSDLPSALLLCLRRVGRSLKGHYAVYEKLMKNGFHLDSAGALLKNDSRSAK